MKNNKTFSLSQSLLPFALVLLTTHAFAASGAGRAGSGNDALLAGDAVCDHCPTQPVSGEIPSFERLQALYEQGTQPTPSQLEGRWRNVLDVFNPELNRAYPEKVDFANENGRINSDGSSFKSLNFTSKSDPWLGNYNLNVTLLNLGARNDNQGPNEVSFHENTACFAQYSYYYGKIYTSAYFYYKCRMVANSTRMLCAYGYEEPLATVSSNQKSWLGKIVGFEGFTR